MSLLFLAIYADRRHYSDRGFEDPAAVLWMTMLAIQSLPYAATVVTAVDQRRSRMRNKSDDAPAPQRLTDRRQPNASNDPVTRPRRREATFRRLSRD